MAHRSTESHGTISAVANFNPEHDAKTLRKAMKGIGTDEESIIYILTRRSNSQRQAIKQKVKALYGRDLVTDFKNELSGELERGVLTMMLTPAEFDAKELNEAMVGVGTDETVLIEILCTRSNLEILKIKDAFRTMYGRDLEKEVVSDTAGHFRKLLVIVLTAQREPEGPVDSALVEKDANDLYEAGEKSWGTDESVFNLIMGNRSYPHLRAVFDEYQKITKHSIESAIKKELSGDQEAGLLAIVEAARDMPAYFARRLHMAMKGAGTDERTLTRVMVSRSEIDLADVKQKFQDIYHKKLEQFIKDDTRGDYQRLLLGILGVH